MVTRRKLSTLPLEAQSAFLELEDRLERLESQGRITAIQKTLYRAIEGDWVRCAPAPGETLRVLLPKPREQNRRQRVRLIIETTGGSTVVSVAGDATINGLETLTFTTRGLVEIVSAGNFGWVTENAPGSLGADSTDLATYHLQSASANLPNARVATDSDEIDLGYGTTGAVYWFLKTASVVFAKLQNLTGLSVLGRAANSTGVMAAITATANRQVLRANDAGTALTWGDPLEVRDGGADQGDAYAIDLVDGTGTTANASVTSRVGSISVNWNGLDARIAGSSAGSFPGIDFSNSAGNVVFAEHPIDPGAGGTFNLIANVDVNTEWTGFTVEENNATQGSSLGTKVIDFTDSSEIELNSNYAGGQYQPQWRLIDRSVALSRLANQSDDTWLGNISGSPGPPTANALSSFAGNGCTYSASNHRIEWTGLTLQEDNVTLGSPLGTRILDFRNSNSVALSSAYAGGQYLVGFHRAALTGEVTASLNSNSTTIARDTDFDWLGSHDFNGRFSLSAVVNDTFSTQRNNYNPSGLADANVLRLTNTAGSVIDITGIVPSSTSVHQVLKIFNVGASPNTIRLRHESGSSSENNRILLPTAAVSSGFSISPDDSVTLWYDTTSSRWRVSR